MHPRFEGYRKTSLGVAIETLAAKPERLTEYLLLSRMGMPAVIALSWDVAPLVAELSEGDRRDAKQFCGAVVGDTMRANGFEIVNPRGSAQAGGVFTFGAVWGAPGEAHERAMRIAREGMEKYKEVFAALAKT